MHACMHAEQTLHRYCLVQNMPRWLQTQWAPTLCQVSSTTGSALGIQHSEELAQQHNQILTAMTLELHTNFTVPSTT